MHLSPQERDKLLIFVTAQLSKQRKERGLKLKVPEATALITAELLELARDRRHRHQPDGGRRIRYPDRHSHRHAQRVRLPRRLGRGDKGSSDTQLIHSFHTEGAGGGHAPDIISIAALPHVLSSSTNPTRPFTVMMSSDSQAKGRVGEMIVRCWQTAHKMKVQYSAGENASTGVAVASRSAGCRARSRCHPWPLPRPRRRRRNTSC